MPRQSIGARRGQLVEAAITVMSHAGVRAATTRAIVAEADVSLSVFHYCFDSKHELLREVVATMVRRMGERSRVAMSTATAGADPAERVRAGLRAYFDDVRGDPAVHLLSYELTQYCLRTPELATVARHQYEQYASTIMQLLRELGMPAKPDTEVLGHYLAIVLDGVTVDWLARRDEAVALAVLDSAAAHVTTLLPDAVPRAVS